MAIRCRNCGGFFSSNELLNRKPPHHPWQLTPAGEKAQYANEASGGDHQACPACGRKTLVVQ